jgi:hypothetical protein
LYERVPGTARCTRPPPPSSTGGELVARSAARIRISDLDVLDGLHQAADAGSPLHRLLTPSNKAAPAAGSSSSSVFEENSGNSDELAYKLFEDLPKWRLVTASLMGGGMAVRHG